jgi:hypothetical protein
VRERDGHEHERVCGRALGTGDRAQVLVDDAGEPMQLDLTGRACNAVAQATDLDLDRRVHPDGVVR